MFVFDVCKRFPRWLRFIAATGAPLVFYAVVALLHGFAEEHISYNATKVFIYLSFVVAAFVPFWVKLVGRLLESAPLAAGSTAVVAAGWWGVAFVANVSGVAEFGIHQPAPACLLVFPGAMFAIAAIVSTIMAFVRSRLPQEEKGG